MTFDVWPILTLLFQGAVAGLIVMYVTKWLEARKAKDLTRKHALLVYLEVQCHLISLAEIQKNKAIPGEIGTFHLESDAWECSREYLTSLPFDDLLHIGSYYQSVTQVNLIFDTYSGPLKPPYGESIRSAYLMCETIFYLLASCWDYKNKQKYRECYRKHLEQISHQI